MNAADFFKKFQMGKKAKADNPYRRNVEKSRRLLTKNYKSRQIIKQTENGEPQKRTGTIARSKE